MTKNEKLKVISRTGELVDEICEGVYELSKLLCTAFGDNALEDGINNAISVEDYPFHRSLEELDWDCIAWNWAVHEELDNLKRELEREDA